MRRLFPTLLLAFACCAVSPLSGAPVQVIKTVRDNPTLYTGEISGPPAFVNALRSYLGTCGWFDLTGTPRADYVLKGSASGSGMTLTIELGGVPTGTWNIAFDREPPRVLAGKTADAIIEKCFKALKVRGFCRSRIVFCAATAPGVRNLYACDIDGGDVEQLTNYNTFCVEPAWSSTGRSVIFSKYNKSGIDVVETTIAKPRRSRILCGFRGINTGAAPSPDGRKLAVILSPDHKVDLYVISVGNPVPKRLTRGIAVEASPAWSPDGSRIVYVSDESGRPLLYIINSDGTGRQRLPALGTDAVTPDWSADNKIVYATRINGSYTIAVLDLKTGRNTRATDIPGSYESPTWAADNRQIVCKRSSGRQSELCVIDTWTGKVRRLLSTSYPLSMPVWSPCPVRQ